MGEIKKLFFNARANNSLNSSNNTGWNRLSIYTAWVWAIVIKHKNLLLFFLVKYTCKMAFHTSICILFSKKEYLKHLTFKRLTANTWEMIAPKVEGTKVALYSYLLAKVNLILKFMEKIILSRCLRFFCLRLFLEFKNIL